MVEFSFGEEKLIVPLIAIHNVSARTKRLVQENSTCNYNMPSLSSYARLSITSILSFNDFWYMV